MDKDSSETEGNESETAYENETKRRRVSLDFGQDEHHHGDGDGDLIREQIVGTNIDRTILETLFGGLEDTVGTGEKKIQTKRKSRRRSKKITQTGKVKRFRGKYLCKKCGKPKKGHVCTVTQFANKKSVSLQCDTRITGNQKFDIPIVGKIIIVGAGQKRKSRKKKNGEKASK